MATPQTEFASQLPPKDTSEGEAFSRWYITAIRRSELADYFEPVGGTMVIRPYGFSLWENMQAALDQRFKLTESMNSEIAHVWYRLAIANRYTAAYPAMERYMIRIGRRKLIVPLYRDLAAYPEGVKLANKIFAEARDGYHPLAQTSVADILKPKT